MSQRESGYIRKERDAYETPEWVTACLLPHLPRKPVAVWEPACGTGKMVRALSSGLPEAEVYGCDIEPGHGFICADFLGETPRVSVDDMDAIITNPPYALASEFCDRALTRMRGAGGVVAMLLRCDFDHAKGRARLFRDHPAFAKKLVLMRRIVWFVENNGRPRASPSFNHAWYIWDWRHGGPPVIGYAA